MDKIDPFLESFEYPLNSSIISCFEVVFDRLSASSEIYIVDGKSCHFTKQIFWSDHDTTFKNYEILIIFSVNYSTYYYSNVGDPSIVRQLGGSVGTVGRPKRVGE